MTKMPGFVKQYAGGLFACDSRQLLVYHETYGGQVYLACEFSTTRKRQTVNNLNNNPYDGFDVFVDGHLVHPDGESNDDILYYDGYKMIENPDNTNAAVWLKPKPGKRARRARAATRELRRYWAQFNPHQHKTTFVHTKLDYLGTVTGRFSSGEPEMQFLPQDKTPEVQKLLDSIRHHVSEALENPCGLFMPVDRYDY